MLWCCVIKWKRFISIFLRVAFSSSFMWFINSLCPFSTFSTYLNYDEIRMELFMLVLCWNYAVIDMFTYRFLAAAARSLWRRFLNQLPTWVGLRPVALASSRFLVGFGYGSWRYHSRNKLRVLSLKQCVFCSPSQIVGGRGNFLRTRYLSTGPIQEYNKEIN